jgi:mono/diheme cytochrome c family protein
MRALLLLALLGGIARAELAASFTSGAEKDQRADRLPALLVLPGEAPTPFLPPGEFTTTWSGTLVLPARQRLVFSFEGEGEAILSIGGKELLSESGALGQARSKSTRLKRGEHPIEIRYRSKPDGSGRFRLFWEERSFPRQSVPPTAFKADVAPDPARHGRQLFARHHCAKCHLPADGFGPAPMAELLELAPLLPATGSRLNEDWLARWIADPAALRPQTRMPALVDASTPEGRQQAADLAAWLMTMKLGDTPPAPDPALAPKGGEHFHRLGCAACHSLPGGPPDPARLSLDGVADKFQPGALAAFLKKPDAWYPHTGMPDFALSDAEANEIAAWLLDASGKIEHKREAFPKGDPAKGAAHAAKLHCGSCHAGLPLDPAAAPPLDAIFTKDWSSQGCASNVSNKNSPRLALSADERAALLAFSKKGRAPLARHVPAEWTSAKLASQNCTACHGIDGKPSLLDRVHPESRSLVAHVAGEDEKVDQSRPHLTFIGEMLHASAIEAMLDGSASPRPRPWLDMRMPAFRADAGPLAQGLARLHGVVPGKPDDPAPDAALAATGKSLVGPDGFGCTTCHGVGPLKPTAAFEVQGINFALSHSRLRREWYDRWMDHPAAVTPGSKMPRYSEKGKSQRPELDGDAAKQFDAIWQYLQRPE